jgi:hypothetical protein
MPARPVGTVAAMNRTRRSPAASRRTATLLALALALLAFPAGAQVGNVGEEGLLGGILGGGGGLLGPVTVNGSAVSASLGIGDLRVDVGITFEQVVGLTPANLGLSARLLSPTEVLTRLNHPLLSAPIALPLVIVVEPPATGGLSFSGVAAIDVHTHNLSFTVDSPLRLYKAPAGGRFVDVTESMGMGSYRARGSIGGFSEFLIVVDLRPTDDAVEAKLDRLDTLLADFAELMPGELASVLAGQAGAIRAAWGAGDAMGAIDATNTFASAVQATAGNPLPNVWRSSRDLTNVAGELRAAAATLRFSLNLAAG